MFVPRYTLSWRVIGGWKLSWYFYGKVHCTRVKAWYGTIFRRSSISPRNFGDGIWVGEIAGMICTNKTCRDTAGKASRGALNIFMAIFLSPLQISFKNSLLAKFILLSFLCPNSPEVVIFFDTLFTDFAGCFWKSSRSITINWSVELWIASLILIGEFHRSDMVIYVWVLTA